MRKPELHLFDFDGTITSRDSLLDFAALVVGPRLSKFYLLLVTPVITLMKLGLLKRADAKMMFLKLHFKGVTHEMLEEHAEQYFKKSVMGDLFRPGAVERIKELKQSGHTVCIVSASLDIWLKPFAQNLQTGLLCSIGEFENGKFTGRLVGKNCNFNEKARRIRSMYNLNDYSRVVAYGDSSGDKAMFDLADESFMRPFE